MIYTIAIWLTGFVAGADARYAVSDIPDNLKSNVNAVVRENKMVYTILSKSKANLKTQRAVTILNEKGGRFARLTVGYDRLTKITVLTAAVYDGEGRVIRRLKGSEIIDQAAQDGFSLYSDDRIKHVDLSQSIYPYTVEFIYEVDYKFLYGVPELTIASDRSSVQRASYQLIYPIDLTPRYRMINWNSGPVREKRGEKEESLTWIFENIPPISIEPHGPHSDEIMPRIMVAPSVFEYDGHVGDMSSWKTFGKWYAELNKDRDDLPAGIREKVKTMTDGLGSVEEKARVLYSYLQGRTRYVSIQLGIGGLQPFPASTVESTGYGDCKALSNYMVSLLKAAGIRGYYAIIQAGENEGDVIRDFPSHQSNHVIVAVPNGQDTLWLECTSQTKAFGYMGKFTGDRTALIITEEGGKLVHTPGYNADQNKQFRTADVIVDASGNAKAKVTTTYTGIQTENGGLDDVIDSKPEEQRKWVQSTTDIPNFNAVAFSITGSKNKIPSAIVTLTLDLDHYASISGKRLFIKPNLLNRSTYIPERVTERKTEVLWHYAYTDIDTVKFLFPETLYPEFIPQPVKLTSRFGSYEAQFTFEESKLVYIRKMKMEKGRFPKESYIELLEFFREVSKYDNVKLVLLNKT
ncbi:MAG: DUF3857 domain-containing protein [Cytophagales bacterium]|nr:DUF3857 domain-containing protein [Cytophagales bacterium]